AGGVITANLGTLAARASATVTIVVTVNADTPDGTTITNTATVALVGAGVVDPNPANDTDTETTTVNAQADIQVIKTDAPDPVIAGQNVTYTISVTNAGPSDAQNVTLSDTVPTGTTFVSFA